MEIVIIEFVRVVIKVKLNENNLFFILRKVMNLEKTIILVI